MAVNPLEGLMSVAVDQQLGSCSTAEPPSAAHLPTSTPGHKQNVPSSREHRKWLQAACGSRTNPASGSVVQGRLLRNQHSPENAARERSRVRNLRQAFHSLQAALPSVPPDTKLSKLDVLVLATNYIAYLTETLDQGGTVAEHTLSSRPGGYLHPVKAWFEALEVKFWGIGKHFTFVNCCLHQACELHCLGVTHKWPMRSLLYCGAVGELLSANQMAAPGRDRTHSLTSDEQ